MWCCFVPDSDPDPDSRFVATTPGYSDSDSDLDSDFAPLVNMNLWYSFCARATAKKI